MCEHSGVSPAAALREARRRRILENSANRLKLIEGLNSSSGEIATKNSLKSELNTEARESVILQKQNSSLELKSKLSEILQNNTDLKEISDELLKNRDEVIKTHEEELEDSVEEEDLVETAIVRQKNVLLKIFLQKRLHYVILALIVNILLFVNAGYLFSENIFCPFYTLKALELITKGGEKDFQPVLLLFIAYLPRNVQKITKIILTLLLTSLSDLCIYLFTFILGTKIINQQ